MILRICFIIFIWIGFYTVSKADKNLHETSKSEDSIGFQIQRMSWNSEEDDYAPQFYGNGILFCSKRPNHFGAVYQDAHEASLTKIYYTEQKQNKKWTLPKEWSKMFIQSAALGPFSLSSDQKTVYVTQSQNKENAKLQVQIIHLENNNWTESEAFSLNKEKNSVGHPSVSKTGNFIVFASDAPGGFGGSDLYISYLKDNKWSRPMNLGPTVNTTGNEITPFIHANGTLYFASTGHGSLGGYDLYSISYNNFEWKGLTHLEHPFNSSSDDHSYISTEDQSQGYFASNRISGKDDDVFGFNKSETRFYKCKLQEDKSYCRTFFENSSSIDNDSLPLTYEWDFGDGIKKKGLEVRHCYQNPGSYIVQLNVVDLITNQIFFNEATYELVIDPVESAYIEIQDTLLVQKKYDLSAHKSVLSNKVNIKKYEWEMSDGHIINGITAPFLAERPGIYTIRMQIEGNDSLGAKISSCVTKNLLLMRQEDIERESKISNPSPNISSFAKTIYSIKDKEGNVYKIQLATSEKAIPVTSKKFEGIQNLESYFDRNVFGYTVGNYKTPEEAYPLLKKYRRQGFKEAVVITMNQGKVVSGSDSSFFIDLPEGFVPLKVLSILGKVKNRQGKPVQARIRIESLTQKEDLGSYQADMKGNFSFQVTEGDLYGYYAEHSEYFPSSNHLDLREEQDVSELEANIIMIKTDELTKDGIAYQINNLFFEPEQYEVSPESFSELNRLATFIRNNPEWLVEIGGHTDNMGDETYNLNLSQKRAQNIMIKLIQLGCPKEKLIAKGYGKSKPLTLNKKLRDLNRRVEFKMIRNK